MTVWDLRQWVEQRVPWWAIPALILLTVMIYGWIEFTSYQRKLK